MSAKQRFNNWITSDVTPLLKGRGFPRSGLSFVSRRGDNWAIVRLQQSSRSTDAQVWFTATLGVWSYRVTAVEDSRAAQMRPSIQDCHWTCRLGELLPDATDYWWSFVGTAADDETGQSVLTLLGAEGLPLLDSMSNDERLCELWLSGQGPGLTALQRLKYLSALLVSLRREAELGTVIQQLEHVASGKPAEAGVRSYIKRLEQLVIASA